MLILEMHPSEIGVAETTDAGIGEVTQPRVTRPARLQVAYLARTTTGGSALSLQALIEGLDHAQYDVAVLFHGIRDDVLAVQIRALGARVVGLGPVLAAGPSTTSGINVTARLSQSGGRGRLLRAYQSVRALERAVRLDLRWQPALLRQLRQLRPALVHCNNGLRSHRLDILLCAALGIPVICHVRNFETLTALEHAAGRCVSHFIYISRALADDFERQGIPAQKGSVIPNALADRALVPAAPAPRAELGWGPETFVVANVGRLVPWKGQDVFLHTVAELAPRLPQLHALIVGEADDQDRSRAFAAGLHALANDLGIAERVTFTGYRRDAIGLMAAADLVVHSAVAPEPFGRVLIEALAAGRPVVATAAGGVLDILEHNVTGLLVPPGDAGALGRAIEQLAGDAALRARLAAAGKLHVATRFGIRQHVREITDLYQACLQSATGTSHLGVN